MVLYKAVNSIFRLIVHVTAALPPRCKDYYHTFWCLLLHDLCIVNRGLTWAKQMMPVGSIIGEESI